MIINTVDKGDLSVVQVEAIVCRDGFALSDNGPLVAVNHVKSGICLTSTYSQERGEELIDIFASIETPSGVRLADMPGCEICASALWLQAEYAKRLPAEKAKNLDRDYALATARTYADVLECVVPV